MEGRIGVLMRLENVDGSHRLYGFESYAFRHRHVKSCRNMETWQSGLSRLPAKELHRKVPQVQIL